MNKVLSGFVTLLALLFAFGCAQPEDKEPDPTLDKARSAELSTIISTANTAAMQRLPIAPSVSDGSKAIGEYVYRIPDGAGTITVSYFDFTLDSDVATGFTGTLQYKLIYDGFEVECDGILYTLDGTFLMAADYSLVNVSPITTTSFDLVQTAQDFEVSSGDYSDTFNIDMRYTMEMTMDSSDNTTKVEYIVKGTIGSFSIDASGILNY